MGVAGAGVVQGEWQSLPSVRLQHLPQYGGHAGDAHEPEGGGYLGPAVCSC